MATSDVKSEVTGSVWKIVTVVGQKLEPGDTIMIIESMKMEIPVNAPAAGRVARVHVSEGDTVQEGQLLVELESA